MRPRCSNSIEPSLPRGGQSGSRRRVRVGWWLVGGWWTRMGRILTHTSLLLQAGPALLARCHIYSAQFYQKLLTWQKLCNRGLSEQAAECLSQLLLRWKPSHSLLDKEFHVMPIGADRHWTCAIACNPKRALGGDSTVDSPACVLYSDSLDGANEPAVDLFRSFMTAYAQKQKHPGSNCDLTALNMPTRHLRVQCQHNDHDCALCALPSQPQHSIPHLCPSYSGAAHVCLRTLSSHPFSPQFW